MEEFDLDEIAELSSLLKIAELEESSKKEKTSTPEPLENPFKILREIDSENSNKSNDENFISLFPESETFIKKLTEDNKKRFFVFIDYLNLVFGEDWDLKKDRDYSLKVVIYFKSVNMSNSDNVSHTIKDFFITFKISTSIELLGSFSGFKTTLTYKEMNTGLSNPRTHTNISPDNKVYIHSHLKGDYSQFKNMLELTFCLGSSELAKNLKYLQSSETCMKYWMPSLLLLEPLVRWESLEGTPYRYMKNIYKTRSRNSIFNTLTYYNINSNVRRDIKGYLTDSAYLEYSSKFIEDYIKVLGFSKGKFKLSIKEDLLKQKALDFLEGKFCNATEYGLIKKICYYQINDRIVAINRNLKDLYTEELIKKEEKDSKNNTEDGSKEESFIVSTKEFKFRDKVFKPTVVKTKDTENNSVQEETILGGVIKFNYKHLLIKVAENRLYNSFLRINYDFDKK